MKYFIVLVIFAVVTAQFVQGQAPPPPPNGAPKPPQVAPEGAPNPSALRAAREISAADVEDISEMDSDPMEENNSSNSYSYSDDDSE